MLFLDNVNRSLEISLGMAAVTTELPWVACYADNTSTTFTPISTNGVTTGASIVTVVAAPAASTHRQLRYFSIYNADTEPAIVLVRLNDNGTRYTLVQVSLLPAETLCFSKKIGWHTLTTIGERKLRSYQPHGMNDVCIPEQSNPSTAATYAHSSNNSSLITLYLGVAAREYRSCVVAFRTTVAAVTVSYAEMGIVRGEPPVPLATNSGMVMTPQLLGFADVTTPITAVAGIQTAAINLSGVKVGDHLWIGWIVKASTGPTFRAMLNTTQTFSPFTGASLQPTGGQTFRLSLMPSGLIVGAGATLPWFVAQFT
jgi:hypothetical protein